MRQISYSYCLAFILCSVSIIALGQKKPKYGVALVSILQEQSSGIPMLLREYQVLEPENGSIDLQLALVYHERYLNSDVLTDYRFKYGNAVKALEYFKSASAKIDEKDVKRNTENYINFGTYDAKGKLVVVYDSVRNRIDQSIPDLEAFVENVPDIYENFTKSYSYYDNALKAYTDLVGQYSTFKDLILLYDEDMEASFKKIATDYQQAIKHFADYRSKLGNYPIPYNQKLKIKRLETYRLDGLASEINFLLPEIEVWDYATWVDETRKYIQTNIDQLRKSLLAEDNRVNKVLANITDDIAADKFMPMEISKEVMFTLRKYDLNSVIEPLFLYKQTKHELLFQDAQNLLMEENPSIEADRKLYLYSQSITKIRQADTLLARINNRNTDDTHVKYPDFLAKQYNGKSGIRSFVTAEQQKTKQDFLYYTGSIRDIILSRSTPKQSTAGTLIYRRLKIPTGIADSIPDEIAANEMFTTHKLVNFDNSAFIAGLKRDDKTNLTITYLAGVTTDGKVAWYKEYMLEYDSGTLDSHVYAALLQAVPGGCALFLHGKQAETSQTFNQFVFVDEGGNDRVSVRLLQTDYPIISNYSDRNSTLQVGFKGFNPRSGIQLNSKLTFVSFNLVGDMLWQQQMEYKGDVFAINTVLDGYLIMGNYNAMRDPDGKLRRIKGTFNDSNVFIWKLNNDGKTEKFLAIEAENPFYGSLSYRVTDDCINVFGMQGSYSENRELTEPDLSFHIMINRNLEVLYNSFSAL